MEKRHIILSLLCMAAVASTAAVGFLVGQEAIKGNTKGLMARANHRKTSGSPLLFGIEKPLESKPLSFAHYGKSKAKRMVDNIPGFLKVSPLDIDLKTIKQRLSKEFFI